MPVVEERAEVRTHAEAGRRLLRVLYALVLDPARKFGSLEEQVFTLARAFHARGGLFLPLYITQADAGCALGYREAGLPVACLDLERFRWATFRRLARVVAANGIEVVHWGMCSPLLNPYVWLLSVWAARVRHYFTDHNSRWLPLPPPGRLPVRLARRALFHRYHRVLCVSRFVEECLGRQGVGSNRACCLHFVNEERFRPDPGVRADLRRQLGERDRFVALVVSHLIRAKGVEVALRALAEVPADVVLWVAGEGEETGALRALADQLGVRERVRFLGLQANVAPFMQAADCLVCPSLWAEAAGLVNLEAQGCGLPVIASRIGGIPEYVEDGRTGLLFPPGDAHALASCLRRLHAAPETCREMGQQARARVEERFSVRARLADYLDLYRAPA